ncbi:unnamed protein product [Bursaphelenchus okinawaensis]|uniref:Uncharacterized protein n=1 Tax=Bursaphelenchus okinawaensis TaxID=465554 RepID=A0A811L9D1_9BILA|nr:unnamed protein product [Bursaphelenchus okinawaensis]CAG9120354.1 unnamed protein product [Bursaphelenchus okinawaensis]
MLYFEIFSLPPSITMAGSADAAKNFLESAFNKTKEVVSTAGESAKGFANVAIENVQKIIPGQQPPPRPARSASRRNCRARRSRRRCHSVVGSFTLSDR